MLQYPVSGKLVIWVEEERVLAVAPTRAVAWEFGDGQEAQNQNFSRKLAQAFAIGLGGKLAMPNPTAPVSLCPPNISM